MSRGVGRPITSRTNYTEAGYDPDDGLTGGRWMRDTWGVVVWVPNEVDAAVSAA